MGEDKGGGVKRDRKHPPLFPLPSREGKECMEVIRKMESSQIIKNKGFRNFRTPTKYKRR